jgi:hypothetical protein
MVSVVNIVTWRGLAALLILGMGQCAGLNTGMGEKLEYSHAFLLSNITRSVPVSG